MGCVGHEFHAAVWCPGRDGKGSGQYWAPRAPSEQKMRNSFTLRLSIGLVLVLSPAAWGLDIVPDFVDAVGETWTDVRKGVVNQAIADWETWILDSGTVDVKVTFANAGTGGYGKATAVYDFRGWRVAAMGYNLALFGDEPLYVKVLQGKPTRLIGLFSIGKPEAKPST